MKSRITIEIDFENGNQPVIQILQRNSEDVRDKLLSSFLQSLQHTSRWVRINYKGSTQDWGAEADVRTWCLSSITPQQLEEEIKLMQATLEHFKNNTVEQIEY